MARGRMWTCQLGDVNKCPPGSHEFHLRFLSPWSKSPNWGFIHSSKDFQGNQNWPPLPARQGLSPTGSGDQQRRGLSLSFGKRKTVAHTESRCTCWHWARCFVFLTSLSALRKVLPLAPFYRWGVWGSQRSRYFPTVTQLGSGGDRKQIYVWLQISGCYAWCDIDWDSCGRRGRGFVLTVLPHGPTGLGSRRHGTLEQWFSPLWPTAVVGTQQRPPTGCPAAGSWEGHA